MKKINIKHFKIKKPDIKGAFHKLKNLKKEDIKILIHQVVKVLKDQIGRLLFIVKWQDKHFLMLIF